MKIKSCRALLGILVLSVGLSGHAAKAPPPSIGVSPSRLEVTVENGVATGSATVLNLSDRTVHINTEVVNFDLDESNRLREYPPEQGTLPAALMLNPVEFTIPPNSSQTVRFAIMPERLDGPGEYRAMMFFSELVDTSARSVKVKFRLGMPIYASFGSVQSTAQVHDVAFEASENAIRLDLTATGNAQVKPSGYYLWWPVSDYPSEAKALARVAELANDPEKPVPKNTIGGPLRTKPVFPGARRSVGAALMPPPDGGKYMLVYSVEVGGQAIQRASRYEPPNLLIVDSD